MMLGLPESGSLESAVFRVTLSYPLRNSDADAPGPVFLGADRRKNLPWFVIVDDLVDTQSLEARLCGLGAGIVDADGPTEHARCLCHWKLA
jgi:hypothetical protein